MPGHRTPTENFAKGQPPKTIEGAEALDEAH